MGISLPNTNQEFGHLLAPRPSFYVVQVFPTAHETGIQFEKNVWLLWQRIALIALFILATFLTEATFL